MQPDTHSTVFISVLVMHTLYQHALPSASCWERQDRRQRNPGPPYLSLSFDPTSGARGWQVQEREHEGSSAVRFPDAVAFPLHWEGVLVQVESMAFQGCPRAH